jgi:DDE superfamily endonuclease
MDACYRRRRIILLALFLLDDDMFRNSLTAEGRRRRDRRIPRSALTSPANSAFERLYSSGNDQALITVTGFDHAAFRCLLFLFEPWFHQHTPWTGNGRPFQRLSRYTHGRRRIINARTCLGLVLAWYRFRGPEYILQGWFGFTGTHANTWLKFGRRGLLIVLSSNEHAKVEMPSDEKVVELCALTRVRHPLLTDVFAVADGLKLYFQQCDGLDEQSMYYNGWKHDHFITNVLVFSVDGKMIATVMNAPGSLHDSTLAEWGGIYDKLEAVYDRTGAKCCVDSAFQSSSNNYMIKSSENITNADDGMSLLRQQQATSLRQAAEWGMRAIQSSFPRLKDRIMYEESGVERRVFLSLVTLLYNYRLHYVGLNQLRNTYMPHLSADSRFLITPGDEDIDE